MKLPTRLADVMLTHHDAPSSDQHPVVKRVHYANDIAHQLGFPELESVPVEVDSAPTFAMVAEWTSRADLVALYLIVIVCYSLRCAAGHCVPVQRSQMIFQELSNDIQRWLSTV